MMMMTWWRLRQSNDADDNLKALDIAVGMVVLCCVSGVYQLAWRTCCCLTSWCCVWWWTLSPLLSLTCRKTSKSLPKSQYSKTCEIRTPLGRAKSVPNWEVSSFHRAVSTENSSLGPGEVSLFHRMSSFRRVAIHRFHCSITYIWVFSSIFMAYPKLSW
jgi:hypothetical protein